MTCGPVDTLLMYNVIIPAIKEPRITDQTNDTRKPYEQPIVLVGPTSAEPSQLSPKHQ
ncbi:uncharacterized protein Smp_200160 [Schistosoma mansoni]|uniref:Smp_200160 n=1 Tax=Schistosoma mansoni TaxID=6183 RepID=G4VAV3_SCHMA|nr:uncharacterized protein Smp_200160 [Schistosoma mansoni]|eukprot:XP_018649406.1 uncharacterized protein Smp_200160 [Schistosoma mansoni]